MRLNNLPAKVLLNPYQILNEIGMAPYIFNTGQRITIETQQDDQTRERFSRVSFYVKSPIDNVYRICQKLPGFPVFLSTMAQQEKENSMRTHRRTLSSGNGDVFTFEVVYTRTVPNQLICWETVPNNWFESEGCIRLTEEARGTHFRMDFSCKVLEGHIPDSLSKMLLLHRSKALKKSIRKLIKLLETEGETHRAYSWI